MNFQCTGDCKSCLIKINRKVDRIHKQSLIDKGDKNIIAEKETIDLLSFKWCYMKYCHIDGYEDNILVDIKNKSEEKYHKYAHDLGLIVKANELMTLQTLKTMLSFKHGYIIYRYADCMMACETTNALAHCEPGASFKDDKLIFYIDFGCWVPISNRSDLTKVPQLPSASVCSWCGQLCYGLMHQRCRIKRLSQVIARYREGSIDDENRFIKELNDEP